MKNIRYSFLALALAAATAGSIAANEAQAGAAGNGVGTRYCLALIPDFGFTTSVTPNQTKRQVLRYLSGLTQQGYLTVFVEDPDSLPLIGGTNVHIGCTILPN
jgi:hypothetical protein